MDHDEALKVVYDAIDVVNRQLPASKRLPKSDGWSLGKTHQLMWSMC